MGPFNTELLSLLVGKSSFASKGFVLIRVAEPSHSLTWEQQDSRKSYLHFPVCSAVEKHEM